MEVGKCTREASILSPSFFQKYFFFTLTSFGKLGLFPDRWRVTIDKKSTWNSLAISQKSQDIAETLDRKNRHSVRRPFVRVKRDEGLNLKRHKFLSHVLIVPSFGFSLVVQHCVCTILLLIVKRIRFILLYCGVWRHKSLQFSFQSHFGIVTPVSLACLYGKMAYTLTVTFVAVGLSSYTERLK